jgi:hypothetical protein
VVDHDDEGLAALERLLHLSDPQALKPIANGCPPWYCPVDAQPVKEHLQRSDGPAKADRSGQIDGERNHARSKAMGAEGRIFWEVDGLSGLITLPLGFDNPLLESFDSLLFLLELLLLLIQLGLKVGDPSAEFADFTGVCLSTPEQNRSDNVASWAALLLTFQPVNHGSLSM